VFVSGRPDVAAALGAQGVQLAAEDLAPADAHRMLPAGWIGRSVHTEAEAVAAVDEGADYLLVGNVYQTASHPGRPAAGLGLVRAAAALGRPVIAIGGIDAARAEAVREAGAWGVAAIAALWRAPDPAAAALALLAPWADDT
jgi:thiamine-phosphate pyrophosphorylase